MHWPSWICLLCCAVLAACSPVRVINGLTSTGAYTLVDAVPYGANPRQRLDIYVPRTARDSGAQSPLPVVVFFYGGSWTMGARSDYEFVGEALAARGFIAVIADYRLNPEVRYPAFLEDCAAAVGFVHRHIGLYGGDRTRLFLFGHSAGAYNVAMLALDPRWLAAQKMTPNSLEGWVGLAGPYDFFPSDNPAVQSTFMHPNYPAHAQPIVFVAGTSVPAFIGAARHDSLVDPNRNSAQLATRLQQGGTQVTYKVYDQVSHATLIGAWSWPLRWKASVLDDVVAFLRANDSGQGRIAPNDPAVTLDPARTAPSPQPQ